MIIVVEGDFTKEELNELEIRYIKEFDSLCPKGYNIQLGGRSSMLPESVKEKIRASTKGRVLCDPAKVSASVKKLWEDPEYRARQIKKRHEKRGKYREGIVKPLRLALDDEAIRESYRHGQSINSIALSLGVAYDTIQRRVKGV